ncbi:transcription factor Sp4 isoform X3 [Heterodontus francisci]|uniref:transcription factor Sp4 isoform X3 n=1 Tax=Heterodontus francisci TaxID=7792 RepID=UPI00355C53AA
MSDQKEESMATLTEGGKPGEYLQIKTSGSQDTQPSPLALLAATCSKIGSPGPAEGAAASNTLQTGQLVIDQSSGAVQQQQLELVTAQLSGNGWQIIAAGPATTKDSATQHQVAAAATSSNGSSITSGQDGTGSPSKARPIVSAAGQFNVVPVQSLPNSTMVVSAAATATGASGGVQYQVIPQIQTVDGQQLQLSSADLQRQIQILSAGHGQTIIAPLTRSNTSANLVPQNSSPQTTTVPIQIRPGLSIPLQLQGINISGAQTQMVATLPINIGGGVTLAVPINSMAATTGGGSIQFVQPSDGGISNGSQIVSTPISTASLNNTPESPPPPSTSTCVTTASPALSCSASLVNSSDTAQTVFANTSSSENTEEEAAAVVPVSEAEGTNIAQSNGLQEQGQLQQVQLAVGQQLPSQLQQQIIQTIPHHAVQTIQGAAIQGQTVQTVQPQGLQNVQLSTLQNPTQVIIRAPSLTPSGQINWQTIQVQNIQNLSNVQIQNAQQLTVTPVSSSNSGETAIAQITPVTGGTINLSAAQLASVPNLQTVNIGSLSSGGVQVQGIPVAITNLAENLFIAVVLQRMCWQEESGSIFREMLPDNLSISSTLFLSPSSTMGQPGTSVQKTRLKHLHPSLARIAEWMIHLGLLRSPASQMPVFSQSDSLCDIKKLLKALGTVKAIVLKTCAPELSTPLAKLFQYSYNIGIYSAIWIIAQAKGRTNPTWPITALSVYS